MTCDYIVIPLHERKELLDECCTLLNSEWKRSYGVRSRSLSQSCDELPCNLLMLEMLNGQSILVGHSRLTAVIGEPKSIFLTSVVIKIPRRGQGLGKVLMKLTEEYVHNKGYLSICLSTDDKVQFYTKCGYVESNPVEQCSGKQLQGKILLLQTHKLKSYGNNTSKNKNETIQQIQEKPHQNIPSPQPLCKLSIKTFEENTNKVWMRKEL
uniref:N-acetyltransferase domain-containing protein n=1 Tax=Ciona savignyi TaxID=51511 RepID=H2ZDC3_CIOSA